MNTRPELHLALVIAETSEVVALHQFHATIPPVGTRLNWGSAVYVVTDAPQIERKDVDRWVGRLPVRLLLQCEEPTGAMLQATRQRERRRDKLDTIFDEIGSTLHVRYSDLSQKDKEAVRRRVRDFVHALARIFGPSGFSVGCCHEFKIRGCRTPSFIIRFLD